MTAPPAPPPPSPRAILHVDMDAFFASIAILDDPTLAGRPVLVGGTGPRAVVAAASYAARKFGCRSAMPMARARRLCPDAVVVQVPGHRIRAMSAAVFAILDQFTPLVEPLSVDEAFLDVTGSTRLLGTPPAIAQNIKDRIREQTGLTASVGVAPNKFLAKLASDMDKPDGLTVTGHTPEAIQAFLDPLPVGRLWGVGGKLQEKLDAAAIHHVSDLRPWTEAALSHRLGTMGARLYRLCRGLDDRPVIPDHAAKSIGQEQTFDQDVTEPDRLRAVLLHQAQQVGRRLRAKTLAARTVTVKIRYGDFQTITRSTTLENPTDGTDTLYHTGKSLFNTWAAGAFEPVRLIGLSAHNLTPPGQTPTQGQLFTDPRDAKQRRVDSVTDTITTRFGPQAIGRAPDPDPGNFPHTSDPDPGSFLRVPDP